MDKYKVKFCECGRVHFLDFEKVLKVCDEDDKTLLFVCNNCGKTLLIWLDECMDGKAWGSRSVSNEEVNPDTLGLIMTSRGEKIYMKTGGYATAMAGGTFIDWETKGEDITDSDRKTVDTKKTINMIRDEEKLNLLSNYAVDIKWKGTKFKKSFNK